MLNSYTLYFKYFCKLCRYFCFQSSIKQFLSIIVIIIIIIIIIIYNSHRCSLPWKQKHFLLLVLDFKDFSQYGGRSTKCRLLQSSDTLWNSNFLQFERYKFFGITPRAPTTTVIIFVFALQRLVIPKLYKSWYFHVSFSIFHCLQRCCRQVPHSMSMVRNLLLFFSCAVMSGCHWVISRSAGIVRSHNIFTSLFSVITAGLCSYHLLLYGRS